MTSDKFDLKTLQFRIQELKQETEESAHLTYDIINCLLVRHSLVKMISENQKFDSVPESITEKIKNGVLPTKEEISTLDPETQDSLIKQLIWICGMGTIAWQCEHWDEGVMGSDNPFEVIISMCDVDEGHYTATYLITAFTLLLGHIPSPHLIEVLTNNYASDEDSLDSTSQIFNELCISILSRYNEDREMYELN